MIGSCDYCGEYCASGLGLNAVENFALPNGWIPPSAIDRHCDLAQRRKECATYDGGHWYPTMHVGPFHDGRGRPLEECRNCSNDSQMDFGDWDATLDHELCTECTDGADLVHEDETGRLWRKEPGDDPIVLVEVVNSTPARNGRRSTYLLQVPPEIETARDAVAWTFRMDGQAYRPDVET